MAVSVVNMIPNALSNETFQDSEPNLAVNPANPLEIAGTAFTVDPGGGSNAPIFVSTDGGQTWSLNLILPSVAGSFVGTFDITLRFAASGLLYLAFLRQPSTGLRLDVLRTGNFSTPSPAPTILVDADTSPGPDQPFIQVATQLGGNGAFHDHVYIGDNDRPGTSTRTSTVEFSNDAANATPPSPSGFVKQIVESRGTAFQDAPQVRPAIHPDGRPRRRLGDGREPVQCPLRARRAGRRRQGRRQGREERLGAVLRVHRAAADRRRRLDRGRSSQQLEPLHRLGRHEQRHVHDPRPPLAGPRRNLVGRPADPHERDECVSRDQLAWRRRPALSAGNGKRHFAALGDAPRANLERLRDDHRPRARDGAGVDARQELRPLRRRLRLRARAREGLLRDLLGEQHAGSGELPERRYLPALDSNRDFYVRDWTDNATSGDDGVEPSTHPYFFTTSDVWNRRSNAPGPFNANDQPTNENPRNGSGVHGRNWAFARIRRNATGVADTVNAKFLFSEFGTGSNFQVAGAATGTNVPFAASELVKTSPAHQWQLPATTSSHLCLAVETSTATDPIVAPSLLGHAPGWPTTDLMVLNDNNKAQRNMGVYPVSGSTPLEYFVIVHNAALLVRDVILDYGVAPQAREFLRELALAEVGGKARGTKLSGTLILNAMQPGENRWVRIRLPAVAKAQGPLPVVFFERHGTSRVNGFAVAPQPAEPSLAGGANALFHADVLRRAAALFGLEKADAAADAAEKRVREGRIDPAGYAKLLKGDLPLLEEVAKHSSFRRDVFAAAAAATTLGQVIGKAAAVTNSHSNLLQALDAGLTAGQKAHGDTADIVQTVSWMLAVLRRHKLTAALKAVEQPSKKFVSAYEHGRVGADGYPTYVRQVLPALEKLGSKGQSIKDALAAMKANLGDPRLLQGAHHRLVAAIDAEA
ncbi:MAG: hypothetical protein E6G48_00765 [Actinobacteria bacterium]|nr:MAG: hypothetical protein E6G48_00765 [Actinomycetota bacterium]